MKPLRGHATKLKKREATTPEEAKDYEHAWQVLFAYEGPEMAMREVGLGPLPGKFSSGAIRKVVMVKMAAMNSSIEEVKGKSKDESTCALCHLAFGSKYDDPNFGSITVTRNRRNKFYCNTCDLFLRICPGEAVLEMPVMVVDVKGSRRIRSEHNIDLRAYSHLVSDFQCMAAAIIQKNYGMVLNTVGDAVIGIWPSGFIPDEVREQYNWSKEKPAEVPAKLALLAAQELANTTPLKFENNTLPFRGALDSTEMKIFSVQSTNKIPQLDQGELEEDFDGQPLVDDKGNLLIGVSEPTAQVQLGPTSIDVAGEAIELSSELSGDNMLGAGDFAITKRFDEVAGNQNSDYHLAEDYDVEIRIIKPE